MSVNIGVLSLQGDFREHLAALSGLNCNASAVKKPADVSRCDGLIIPGGESTTIGKLCERFGVGEAIKELHRDGKKVVWGTCAGAILLAKHIVGSEQWRLGLMDMEVKRNAFGRQVDSFEADVNIDGVKGPAFRAVFIRAPAIVTVSGNAREMARHGEHIVMARQKNLLATTFHPELTDDRRVHQYFLDMVTSTAGG